MVEMEDKKPVNVKIRLYQIEEKSTIFITWVFFNVFMYKNMYVSHILFRHFV